MDMEAVQTKVGMLLCEASSLALDAKKIGTPCERYIRAAFFLAHASEAIRRGRMNDATELLHHARKHMAEGDTLMAAASLEGLGDGGAA